MVPYYVMFSIVLFQDLVAGTTNSNEVCDAVHRGFVGTHCLHLQDRKYDKQAASSAHCFNPKTADSLFFRNVGQHLPDYMLSYLKSSTVYSRFLPYPNIIMKALFSDALMLSSSLRFYSPTKQEANGSALFEFRE